MALQQQLKMYHLKSLPMCQHWMNTYLISKWPTATPALCLNKIPLPTSSTERGSVSHTSIIWQFNHQKLSHYDKSNTYFYLFIILPPDSSAFSTSGTFASALSQSFRTGHVHLTAHVFCIPLSILICGCFLFFLSPIPSLLKGNAYDSWTDICILCCKKPLTLQWLY